MTNRVIDYCNTKKRHDRTDRERAEMPNKKMEMDDSQVASMVFSTTHMPLVAEDLSHLHYTSL
jgi:hypothetical protein